MKLSIDNKALFGELSTLTDFMRWGASRFVEAELSYSHGMSSPLDEAVYLVLRSLHLPVDTPEVYWNSKLTQSEKEAVLAIFKRRIEERIACRLSYERRLVCGFTVLCR